MQPIALRLMGLFAGAHAVGAALIFVYLNLVLPGSPEETSFALASLLLFSAVVGPLAFLRVLRVLRPIVRWLEAGRRPDADERSAVLYAPWRLAKTGFQYWLLAVVVFTTLNVVRGSPRMETFQEGGGIFIGGVTTCALVLLLVERSMRPLFAQVLTGAPHSRPATIGIRARLLGSWALGSGIPLLAILGAQLRGRLNESDARAAVIFLSATALVIGAFALAVAARSVSDPIDHVRGALRRLQAGDLEVRVPVDDGGELGLLQAGFNEMVEGLRERLRLEDLLGRHVGESVARQELERGGGLGGELRAVTVLFVDLVGSSALTERHPPEDVVDLLNDFFAAVVEAVAAEGGWVNKFEGDGALCVFGAPLDQPDHAARALRAAHTLRLRLLALATNHPNLDAGIGVSSGNVVAGNVGTEERYEYTVIGDPVNEAARLTEVAKTTPARVIVSGRTVEWAGTEASCWYDAGSCELRGRSHPTRVFTLAL